MINEHSSPEDIKETLNVVSGILDELYKLSSPQDGLQILSSCATYLLCNGFYNPVDADNALKTFCAVTSHAVSAAEEMGETIWTRGTIH